MIEQITKVATNTVDALKAQPLSLALILVNVLFLIAGGLFVYYLGGAISAEREQRNALLKQVLDSCTLK